MASSRPLYQYMVEFNVPVPFPPELVLRIPDQRKEVDQMFQEGKLMSYSLSEDRDTLWAVFLVEDNDQLERAIGRLPLSPYMSYKARTLLFHQSIRLMPTHSLN